jgi:hypothetical protein
MKLSDQAMGAIMMALQKSLLEQTDIVPVLRSFNFVVSDPSQSELVVTNPPNFKVENENSLHRLEETNTTVGSD